MSVKTTLIFWIFVCVNLVAGQNILNAELTFNHVNMPVKIIFNDIQKQTGTIFSYSEFDDTQKMSLEVTKTPLKHVIARLETELQIRIAVKDKYLIIKPLYPVEPNYIGIRGIITNHHTEEAIANASVYVKKNKILVQSDHSGHFAFAIPSHMDQIKINVAKENFKDTVITLASKNQDINIKLRSFPRTRVSDFEDINTKDGYVVSMDEGAHMFTEPKIKKTTYSESFWDKMKKKNLNLLNITDTILNSFSLSLIPPISTNKMLSFHTKNTLSLNIIGGNAKGLNGVEIGGVYNYDAGDIHGVQMAGVINAISEDINGVQVSGVMNAVKGNSKGLQTAGVINTTDGNTTGIQVAGIYQSTHNLNGLQLAGIYNAASKVTGGQFSGIVNRVDSASTLLQIAGIYNQASHMKGIQISGLINTCDTLQGLQFGLYNRANYVKNGMMVGLFNYVKGGYHKLELSYNELGTATIGLRSGWAPLHFLLLSGINQSNKDLAFVQFGMGFASSLRLSERLFFEADVNVRSTHDADCIIKWYSNMSNQLLIGLSYQPAKKLGIRSGITFNHYWYDPSSAINSHVASLTSKPFTQGDDGRNKYKMWIGWQIGLLFF
jgi:hypothetical protein